MNVLIYASSASHQLSNALRSVLSPFYTVQTIVPGSLATQPWTASCALLVLSSDNPPAPLSLPKPAHEAIQDYVTAGGRILGVGLGASLLPHRPGRDRFDLWDARSNTAIVPESPQDASAHSPPSSILLRTGTSLSGLRPAGVSFELKRIASDSKGVHGHWEEVNGAVAGIQVPIGSGHAAFWGISPYLDGIEDTASVLALLRYVLTSLELLVPPETIPDGPFGPIVTPLPQFLLHPPGKRHITESVIRGLGLQNTTAESSDDSDLGVIKDTADTFRFHKVVTLEDAARLMAEARRVSDTNTSLSHAVTAIMDAPRVRVVVVVPPDVLPTRELTPQFDARKYFEVLASVRVGKLSDVDSWGMGEALFYGEAVTSTQTMLDRYVPPQPLRTHPLQPYTSPARSPSPQADRPTQNAQESAVPGVAPYSNRLPRHIPTLGARTRLQHVALAAGVPAILHPRPRTIARVGAPRASPRLRAVSCRIGHRPCLPRRARAGRRDGCTRAAQVA